MQRKYLSELRVREIRELALAKAAALAKELLPSISERNLSDKIKVTKTLSNVVSRLPEQQNDAEPTA
jgi:hypothetical protein